MTPGERRRLVVIAGHRGERDVVDAHLADDDAGVRDAVLGALARMGALTDAQVVAGFGDPAPVVRRRAAALAAARPGVALLALLDDPEPSVVEVAAWACGEQERVDDATLGRLIALASESDDALVRESAAAALGAIGDVRGLPAILVAVRDKPNVRRRAVLALAPFDGPDVEAAIEAALSDRDWQVRQAAEDLRRATGELDV
ncbi:MAG TPA: HEAT repeat domain-containing protein [Ilumatobacter sp.]|jgi:HEAT repeat protein|nr:HEAT repeat domain-containing protein [Ilumatobacter sp.]